MHPFQRAQAFKAYLVLLDAAPLVGHHSTADYVLKHPAMVTGVVTGFAWASPPARIDPDSTNVHGNVEHWLVEIDSPNASAEDWLAQGHVKDE